MTLHEYFQQLKPTLILGGLAITALMGYVLGFGSALALITLP